MQHLKNENQIILNPLKIDSMSSSEMMSFYLRSFMGRQDLSLFFSSLDNSPYMRLERIRSLIRDRQLSKANTLIKEALTKDIDPELYSEFFLEKLRVFVFEGLYNDVILESDNFDKKACNWMTLLSIVQIRTKALFELTRHHEAINEIIEVLPLTKDSPYSWSSIALRAHLILAYQSINKNNEANKELKQLESIVNSITENETWIDRYITLLRTQYRFFLKDGQDTKALTALVYAKEFSELINKKTTLFNCLKDIDFHGEVPHKPIYKFQDWVYFKDFQLIFIHSTKKIHKIGNSDLLVSILSILMNGPIEKHELFQTIWNLELNSDSRNAHLRSTLSHLRKFLPKNALKVTNGIVTIS